MLSGLEDFGGLVGLNDGTVTGSYWDAGTTKQATSAGGIGLTTAQMQDVTQFRTLFAWFDFDTVWAPPSDAAHSSDGMAHYSELYALSHIVAATAGSGTRVYGDAAATLTAATYVGLHIGDSLTTLGTDSLSNISNVGTYSNTLTGVTAKAASGVDYRIVSVPGAEVVTPRALTITPDGVPRLYGDGNPTSGTAMGDGFVNDDTVMLVDLATSAGLASHVGRYDLTASAAIGTGLENYTISYAPRMDGLIVTPRLVSIAADTLDRIYGDANPQLTWTVGEMGLANGDMLSGSLATTAELASTIGPYAIDQGTLAASSDYIVIGYTSALLTVTPRALTITADALGRIYGDINPTSGTATGNAFVNGDTVTQVALATPAGLASHVGSYDLSASAAIGTGLENYTISYAPRMDGLSVTPRLVSIAADTLGRIYGDANPELTWTVGDMWLANGDMLSGSLATTAELASTIGPYAIDQGTLAASSDYIVTGYTSALLTVTPRALTITADALSRIYADANPTTGTATGGNFANGDTVTQVTLSTQAGLTSHVGSYDLTASAAIGTGLENYTISYAPRMDGLSVTQRALTIVPEALSRVYGDANPTSGTATGNTFVNGDTVTQVVLSTPASSASHVGSYDLTASGATGTGLGNYSISYAPLTNGLSVTPRIVSIAADALDRIYGNANPQLTWAVGGMGLVNGDRLSGSLATAAGLASSIGTYAIGQGTLAASSDYRVTDYTSALLTVTPRALTITADALSRIYGDANPTSGTATGDNFVNGDTVTQVALATPAGLASHVGSYDLSASAATGTGLGNYTISYAPQTGGLSVTPRPVSIAANALDRIYGEPNPQLTWALGGMGLVNGDMLSGSLAITAGLASSIGIYAIGQGTLAAASDYRVTGYTSALLTVMPRALTITADALTRTYGDANPTSGTATGNNFANGDTVTQVTLSTPAGLTSHVGSYDLDASAATGTGLGNYMISYAPRTDGLSVTPRTISIVANALDRIYGNANPQLTWAVGGMGLVNGDMLSGSLAITAGLASSIGTYAIGQGTLAAASDYRVTGYTSALLTVMPRALTITADALSRIYGDANPTSGTATGDNFVNGDTVTQVTLSTPAGLASHVGSYDLDASAATGTGLVNYTISYAPRTDGLSVTPRTISIVANALDRIYGNVNPPLTWIVGGMGLVNGDMLSGSLATTAELASTIGTYAIGQGTLAAASDYRVTGYTSALLTVTPRALTITADALSRIYGDANPTSGTATGDNFVNGDTVTQVALATPAGLASHVGSYDLSASAATGTGLGNYTISYAPLTNGLSVTPRIVSIAADALDRIYGNANPQLTWAVGGMGLVNGDRLSGSLATAAGLASSIGTYAIGQGTLAASSDYRVTGYTSALLTVMPRALTITANALSRIYGDANPTSGTATGDNFVNGDTVTQVTLSTPAGLASHVGSYDLDASAATGTGLVNYTISYAPQTGGLSVTPRPVSIAADPLGRIYGDANPQLTWAVSGMGLVNGDMLSGSLATSAGLASTVGNYAIRQGTLAVSRNYNLNFVPGTLTIRPFFVADFVNVMGTATRNTLPSGLAIIGENKTILPTLLLKGIYYCPVSIGC